MNSLIFWAPSPTVYVLKYLRNLIHSAGPDLSITWYTDSASSLRLVPDSRDSLESKVEVIEDVSLRYLHKRGSNRQYKGVLDYFAESRHDQLFFPKLLEPEYLVAELESRSLEKSVSAAVYGTADSQVSRARAVTYGRLLSAKSFTRLFVHSIAGSHDGQSESFVRETSVNREKIVYLADPAFDPADCYQVAPTGKSARSGPPRLLYFGAFHFGKGIDILSRSLHHLDNNFELVVAGDPSTKNFEFDLAELEADSRVRLRASFQTDEEMFDLFRWSDMVILPYRKTYEHGTSGVFVQAVSAGKTVVVPDIAPFSQVLKNFPGLGASFEAENARSLADTINDALRQNLEPSASRDYAQRADIWDQLATFFLRPT